MNAMVDRLTRTHLNDIFARSTTAPDCLKISEDELHEYKKSFSFDDKLMKTCAAFANNRGGYIVFGIEDGTRRLVGLSSRKLRDFDNYDIAKATAKFNALFSPSIRISKATHNTDNMQFGVIYVYQCETRPVIATNGTGSIKDGDIFFSYGARRERIKYAELHAIFEENVDKRLSKFFRQIDMIAQIGIENAAIMNTESGDVSGPTIRKFVIDKELLDDLKFVKEGEFTEKMGAPALRLVGMLETRTDATVREASRHITHDEVYRAFIARRIVDRPLEYLLACCCQQSWYSPIYYFAKMTQLDRVELSQSIRDFTGTRAKTVKEILKRIDTDENLSQELPDTGSDAYIKRAKYRTEFLEMKEITFDAVSLRHAIFALRTLNRDEIVEDYIFTVLNDLYEFSVKMKANELSDFRKSICHIDRILNST